MKARPAAKKPLPAIAGAAAAAAVAYFVNYRLTPERLTPGFEHRLSRKSMTAVYACFALGLAWAAWWPATRGCGRRTSGDAARPGNC